jgi:aldehyde:ferredoxin oxidoreductase
MPALDLPTILTWTNCVTGWDMDAAELLRAGERSFNLKRLLNLSCGVTGADDTLPRRFTHEPFQEGLSAGQLPDLEKMLAEYYAERGWDTHGVPTPAKLVELGLS